MHCFEINDQRVVEGLRVQPDPKAPFIEITSDGVHFISIDPKLAELVQRAAANDRRPIRIERLTMSPGGDCFTSGGREDTALVRIDVSSGKGGLVTLSAANDRGEKLERNRVTKSFGPFPPLGIVVHGPEEAKTHELWTSGAPRLELFVEMAVGASFRIVRTRPIHGVPSIAFVTWTGKKLDMTKIHASRSFATFGDVMRDQMSA